jgi:DNA polymerase elongation subunit (family B)
MYALRSDYKKKMLNLKKEVEALGDGNKELIKEKNALIEHYDIEQNTIKIKLNSAYGWLGCKYSRFYNVKYAEAVTITGQLVTRTIFETVNKYLATQTGVDRDRILMSDTDSLFVTFEGIVNNKISIERNVKKIEKFSKEVIEPLIDKCVSELTTYLNCFENVLSTKLEKIANVGVITKKKRYMMIVQYNEGVYFTNPKLTVVGLDTVRSTTPAFYRDKLKTAYEMICRNSNDDLINFIDEVKKETFQQPIEMIAFPKGVNNIAKYRIGDADYKSRTPINTRASILYNDLIKKKKLQKKYEPIKEGDKIKFIYLTMPNPVFSDVVAFPSKLPKEFELDKYIDYDKQFEKCFLSPLETMTSIIGWKAKRTVTLDELF